MGKIHIYVHILNHNLPVFYLISKMEHAKKFLEHTLCIQSYRQVHILEKMLNDFLMTKISPAVVIFIPAVQIVSQFVSVMMHDKIAMPGFLIFPLFLVDGFVANVLVFTLASWVNSTPHDMLVKYGRRLDNISVGGSYLRKEVKALNSMKIKFWSNYIDRGTPLMIQNFCLAQTMSLIMIRSSS